MLVLLLGIPAIPAYFYCFRSVSWDNPALGLINYNYRFCRLSEITADVNRDGIIDTRAVIQSHDNKPRSTGFSVLEAWESVDLDGVLNLHYYYHESVLIVELDLDKNGSFEERFEGEAAADRLREIQRFEVDQVSQTNDTP